MAPEFLLEALFKEQVDPVVVEEHDEFLSDITFSDARITREPQPESGQAVVAVVGLGNAGLPSAMALRRAGFQIVAIDASPRRLNDIRSGRSGLTGAFREDLRRNLKDRDFVLTDRIEGVHTADLVMICVASSVDRQRHPNPDTLRRTCAAVVENARAGQTIVLASTGYVGCTRELLVEPLAGRGLQVGEDVFVACSPERGVPLDGGERTLTPRVVGALSDSCFAHAAELLRHVSERLHRVSSPEAAEMSKLYESTFSAVNTALAFEMADACRCNELDVIEVTEAAATRPTGFMAHYPSAGIGGDGASDPHYLLAPLRERGRPATLAEDSLRSIAARPRRIAARAHELLLRTGCQLRDARVLVVGAAHAPGISDVRQSPASEIIARLQADGVQVDFHDPLVPELQVDGETITSVDPDPRRDASGFGPEDYSLAILVTVQPGHDYGWLRRVAQVLDCTYREHTGRRSFLP